MPIKADLSACRRRDHSCRSFMDVNTFRACVIPRTSKKIRSPGNKGGKGVFAHLKGMPSTPSEFFVMIEILE
jgi:hypothetical protein